MRLTLLVSTLFFAGCGERNAPVGLGPGHLDFVVPISGEYELARSSSLHVAVLPKGKSTARIPPTIVDVGWDNEFVIARRQVTAQTNFVGSSGKIPYDIPVQGKFDFWILNTKAATVFGPLTEAEFAAKRIEFGVPTTTTLKDVYSYRPN
jgi:hypothetical protein